VADFAYKLNENDLGKLVGCFRLLLRGIVLLILVGFFIALFHVPMVEGPLSPKKDLTTPLSKAAGPA